MTNEPNDARRERELTTATDPHLTAVYTRLYFDLSWPAALPTPEEVRICWNSRFRKTSGACQQNDRIIEINTIYQDPRLSRELEYLLIHEAAHFIWRGHPPAFKQFLRSVAVPERYVLHRSEPSPLYRLVHRERTQPQLLLFAEEELNDPRARGAERSEQVMLDVGGE